jgi:K+-transporting ATPase ATPase C chain
MTRKFLFCIILYLVSLVLIGLYSVSVYIIGHKFWPENRAGSLIYDNDNNVRGSFLLSQKINSNKYFKGRVVSKIHSSCDVALYSPELKKFLLEKYNESDKYDIAFITPSSSLLDPYITTRDALRQAPAIAFERNISLEEITSTIQNLSLKKSDPFFELEIVNTTHLNALLDKLK